MSRAHNRSGILIYLLPLLLLMMVWSPMLFAPFLWDDGAVIVQNRFMLFPANLRLLFSHDYFLIFGEASYRPIVTLSHIIDSTLWGTWSAGHHLTNLLLHCVCVVVLIRLMSLFDVKRLILLASVVLFAVHPIVAETLGVVAYRDDLLAALFFLCALYQYIQFERSPRLIRLGASALCLSLALFAKETALLFVVIVVVYNMLIRRPIRMHTAIAYLFFMLCSGWYVLVRFVLMANPAQADQSEYFSHTWPVFVRPFLVVDTAFYSLCNMLMRIDYHTDSLWIMSIIGFMLLIGTVFVLRNNMDGKAARLGWLIFIGALVPVMNIVPLENMFTNRYMYLPLSGFMLALSAIGFVDARRVKHLMCVLAILVIVAAAGFASNRYFQSETAFAQKLAVDSPYNYKAYNYLGTIALEERKLDEAAQYFDRALAVEPTFFEAVYNRASVALSRGRFDGAKKYAARLLKLNPERSEGYRLWGDIAFDEESFEVAEVFYQQALEHNRYDINARLNLGVVYEEQGDDERAAGEYRSILAIDQRYATAWSNLGNINLRTGDYDFAIRCYSEALRYDGSNAVTWYNLGNACFYTKDYEQAARHYGVSLQLDRNNADTWYNLAIVYRLLGRADAERSALEVYLSLNPSDAAASQRLRALQGQ